jgi:pimeloyl-ACP methyl ester carboxylesterase
VKGPITIVPGTGCGRWTYERLAASLVELTGRHVVTLALAGLGERASEIAPNISVDTHAADVVAQLASLGLRDVTLVGHSYGGAVVTGALASPLVSRAVYLDAFVPRHGESILAQHAGFAALVTAAVGDGWQIPAFPGDSFADDADTIRFFNEHASPSPFHMYESALSVDEARFAAVPKGYVACSTSKFRYFMKLAEQKRALGWPVAVVATGHLGCYTEPLVTARAVLEAEPS